MPLNSENQQQGNFLKKHYKRFYKTVENGKNSNYLCKFYRNPTKSSKSQGKPKAGKITFPVFIMRTRQPTAVLEETTWKINGYLLLILYLKDTNFIASMSSVNGL